MTMGLMLLLVREPAFAHELLGQPFCGGELGDGEPLGLRPDAATLKGCDHGLLRATGVTLHERAAASVLADREGRLFCHHAWAASCRASSAEGLAQLRSGGQRLGPRRSCPSRRCGRHELQVLEEALREIECLDEHERAAEPLLNEVRKVRARGLIVAPGCTAKRLRPLGLPVDGDRESRRRGRKRTQRRGRRRCGSGASRRHRPIEAERAMEVGVPAKQRAHRDHHAGLPTRE